MDGDAAHRSSRSGRRQRAGAGGSRKRRDRADAGLRRLAQRQWLRPRRLARDARARARRRPSRRRHHHRFQSQPADAQRRAALRRAGEAAQDRRRRSICAPASIRSAALPPPAASPRPWSELSKRIGRAGRASSPTKAFAGRSRSPTGASSTMPAARRRRSLPSRSPPRSLICARWRRAACALDAARGMIYFRLAADADQFLTIAKFRAIRKLWARVEEACGLTPKPADRRRRNRVAHDDPARPLREHAAHDHRGFRGRPRRRRRDHGAAVHRRASACPMPLRAASRATRNLSCWRSPISRRSPIPPPAPAASRI